MKYYAAVTTGIHSTGTT